MQPGQISILLQTRVKTMNCSAGEESTRQDYSDNERHRIGFIAVNDDA